MNHTELLYLIRHYKPFDSISEYLLDQLVSSIEIKVGRVGATLFDAGDYDPDEFYLVSGKLRLIAKDGRESVVEAGQGNSNYPIARLRPRMYTAKAATDIRYFVISKSVLDELQKSVQAPSHNVVLSEMKERAGEDGNALFYEFQQELANGRFVLPSLPEVALQIRRQIEDPDCNIKDIANVVNTDPAIAAKLLKTANSVIYRRDKPYTDVQSAIARLGLVTTKQLVTSFAILGLFKADSSATEQQMREIWRQSVEVAAYSYAIAKALPTLDEGEAMLAGLLHNIGEVVILSYAERFYDLATDERHLSSIRMLLRGKIGAMVLEKWDFSPELVVVARDSANWLRDSDTDFDYCDLVQVAALYAAQEGDLNGMPDMQSVPAFQKLALTQEQANEVIATAQEQISEFRQIFQHSAA